MRRGQYPNPTFLNKAEGIRKKRHTKLVIAVTVLVLVALFVLLIRTGARLEKQYEQEYPDLVGAATAVTTEHTELPPLTPLEPTETQATVPTETEEALVPIIYTEPPVETIDFTDLSADPFEEPEPFYFRTSYPLQTISHEQRDVLLDVLKQNVLDYINSNPGERICFRYINLDTGETLGLNDLEPIVPAGAFALPIELTYWHRVDMGFASPQYVITYDGTPVPGSSSIIASLYPPGKMFYLRTLVNLAITDNDDYALNVVLDRSGGIETVWNYLSTISGYINYTENAIYTDYQGSLMRGTGRTSCYDMAAYAEFLYYGYLSQPDVYQSLINDLAYNPIRSPFMTSFGEDVPVLHVMGRNETFHAYTDVAIIDASEPIVLIVYCECASFDRALTIEADISGHVANFLNACHASDST
ncbi:MAG: serine hydrolase [Clostridiales bacterium]|nr:serine hydrolase [Clostridiales bacterium]